MAAATTAAAGLPLGKNPKKRLFEDEDDEDEDGGADIGTSKSIGKPSSFTINEEYARRFEHNKKREEKQKLEEKYGKKGLADDAQDDSDESSDDESEDEDGYLLTEELDARMSAALQAIKNKDPRIYDTEVKFFDPAEAEKAGEEAAAAASSKSKEKPMSLRDYHRERYLRGDVGAEDEDEDEDAGAPQARTYQQEQDEIKRALIAEMNAADDDEDGEDGDTKMADKGGEDGDDNEDDDVDAFIKPKAASKASRASAAANGVHPSRADRIVKITEADVANADKNPELFLSNFLASRAWVPEDEDETGPRWQAFESDDDDEAERDRAEAFEAAYNLRFEDPDKSNEVLKSYSRTVVAERSVRREAQSARQRQREQERAQQAAEKQARREERARLRKLRVDEAQEKLAKIKQAAGMAGRVLAEDEWTRLLDDAWDNAAWEAEMQKQFGDAYYAEKDADAEAELLSEEEGEESKSGKTKKPKKPKWDDDIDIKDLIPDFEDDEAPKITLTDSEGEVGEGENEDQNNDGSEDDEEEEEGDDGGHQAKRRKTGKDRKQERADAKRTARRERARIEALVDRQMALDDPTALAGPSSSSAAPASAGFRYRETSPQAFGLTARDILLAPSDAALNEFAGLKKLAVFRDEARKRKDRKKLGKKARLRQWRRDTFGADYEQTGPTFGFERFVDQEAEAAAAINGHSRKGKNKDKSKGKSKDKETQDGSEPEKTKKKRKRSGPKNKDKGKGVEQEA